MIGSPPRSSHERRVPAEHRLLGLDKRSFPYALFVVGVFVLLTVVVPRVNTAIAWDDPVHAGDRLALTGDIVFTPAVGWEVESGYRIGDGGSVDQSGEAKVVSDGVTFSIEPAPFDGTPSELLDQVEKVTSATDDPSFMVAGDPATVTTPSGEVGVIQSYSSVNGDGLVAAFVIGGTGLAVLAYGPPAQLSASQDEVRDMIASITTLGDGRAA
jgi:hypothetical protein